MTKCWNCGEESKPHRDLSVYVWKDLSGTVLYIGQGRPNRVNVGPPGYRSSTDLYNHLIENPGCYKEVLASGLDKTTALHLEGKFYLDLEPLYGFPGSKKTGLTARPVALIDQGVQVKTFESIQAAATEYGLSPGGIHQACVKGYRSGGHYWDFI